MPPYLPLLCLASWYVIALLIHLAARRLVVSVGLMAISWLFTGVGGGWLFLQGATSQAYVTVGLFTVYSMLSTWTLLPRLSEYTRR
jgi:hypothetical protein